MDEIGQSLVLQGWLVRKKKRLRLAAQNKGDQLGEDTTRLNLKNRLREIVMAGQEPELSEKVLLAFLYYTKLLKFVFPHGERKDAHKRVKKLIANEEEGSGLGITLDKIIAAVCEINE
jgi:hypothetical protein